MSLPLDVGRAGLRLALFVLVLAGVVLLITRPGMDSPGFVVTLLIAGFAGFTAVVLLVLMRLSHRGSNPVVLNEEEDQG